VEAPPQVPPAVVGAPPQVPPAAVAVVGAPPPHLLDPAVENLVSDDE
jgi:hypothetical protein